MFVNFKTKADSCWTDKISEFSGNMFHSPKWAATRCSFSSRPMYIELCDRVGTCHGIALGIEVRSQTPFIGRFSRQLEFETYPVVRDDRQDLLQNMVQQIIIRAKRRGYRRVIFNSYLARTLLEQPARLGLEIGNRLEFSIDLTQSDEQLISNFSTHHKRKIKKARKHEMIFHESQNLEGMRQFRQLQVRSRDRRIERGEDMAILDDNYYEELGKRYFGAGLGSVFMMLHDGRPVSAAFVAHFGEEALYMYGGSSDMGFKMDAPPLLFSHIFSRCREKGYRTFNLGGVPAEAKEPDTPSHGLYRFKAGFGGDQRQCQNAVVKDLNPKRDKLLHLIKRVMGR